MHRFLAVSVIVLACAAGVFAQDNSQTIQVGYGVITPSFPIANNMLVFENVIHTRTDDTTEATLLPPVNLFTNVLMPVDVSNTLGKNVGIAVANPSAAVATLTLTLRKSDGTQFSTATLTIPTRRQISKLLTELFPVPAPGTFTTTVAVPSEFTGTLTMTSTIPVSLIGLKFRETTFSLIPLTDFSGTMNLVPAISSGVGGLGAVVLTQFVIGGGWSTEVQIVNLTANSITVRLDLFTPDGLPLQVKLNAVTASSFTNLVVPASGSLTIAPSL